MPTHIDLNKHTPFGFRLKSAREALGIDRKEAATQLRLHESIIIMIESGEFQTDLPLTFIRGYIRNYCKLLDIPEQEIKNALITLQPKPEVEETPSAIIHSATNSNLLSSGDLAVPVGLGNFFKQLFSYLIAITIIGLMAIWWHSHKTVEPNNTIVIPAQPKVLKNTEAPTIPPLLARSTRNQSENQAIQNSKSGIAAPIPVFKPHPIVTPSATANVTKVSHFPHGNKELFKQQILGDIYLQPLMDFILFLLIITISMRCYIIFPTNIVDADSKSRKYKLRKPSLFAHFKQFCAWIGENKKNILTVFGVAILVLSACITLYNSIQQKKISLSLEASAVSTSQESIASKPIPSEVEIAALTQPNFNSILLAIIQINALQSIILQLDHYIVKNAAVKSTLIDSYGSNQLIHKKRGRKRHHPAYYYKNNNTSSDTYITSY